MLLGQTPVQEGKWELPSAPAALSCAGVAVPVSPTTLEKGI